MNCMKIRKITSFILLFVLISISVSGQSRTVRRANSFFERGEYFRALELFEEALESGETLDVENKIRVAHCHYELNNIDVAFERFMELEEQLKGQDLLVYANVTQGVGFYEGAIDLYERCLDENIGNAGQIRERIRSCEWAIENIAFRTEYYVNPSELLTFGQSFGIQYYRDGVVYSSASGEGDEVDRYGREFLNLYYSPLEGGEILDQRLFSENLVFDYHVGAISFTSDENTMYYTRAVRVRGGDSRIKIFQVTYDGNEWGNEQELSINSDNYDCAYPATTPDDKYLIFASNMSGGHGETDLYIVEKRPDGSFGQPRNLGPEINTFGYERFPFVSDEYDLYFASDGHIGFGGLDIFKATRQSNTTWENVENMMQPINSNKDDFGYVIDPSDPDQGFLSSNRLGSGDEDVIFYVEPRIDDEQSSDVSDDSDDVGDDTGVLLFDEYAQDESENDPEPEPEPDSGSAEEDEVDLAEFPDAFSTNIISSFNGDVIEGVRVVIKDYDSNQIVVEGRSDRNGTIHLTLPDEFRKDGQSFEVSVNKGNDFNAKNMVVDITELDAIARNGIILTPVFDDVVLDDIGTMIVPYRGEAITSEGQKVLDKLAVYLKNNPNIVVKLNSHTDARGNKYNNLRTSQKVAEKAEEYLLKKGIDDRNLIPRGYGERYLINKCQRGVLCNESEHLENRRIEIVVWKKLQ